MMKVKDYCQHLAIALLTITACLWVITTHHFNTDILNLFDNQHSTQGYDSAAKEYEQRLSHELNIVVTSQTREKSILAAKTIKSQLYKSTYFEDNFSTNQQGAQNSIYEYLNNHIGVILSAQQISNIITAKGQAIYRNALEQIYSPVGTGLALIEKDPLFLSSDFLKRITPPFKLEIKEGELVSQTQPSAVLIFMKIKNGHSRAVKELIEQIQNSYRAKEIMVAATSISFFNQYAKDRTLKESLGLSSLSLVLIAALFMISLGSTRLLFITSIHILFSFSIALLLTILIFKEIHLISLLLGLSSIGLIADHVVHFFVKQYDPTIHSSVEALDHIKRPLLFSFATTTVGFMIFFLAGHDFFHQFALLSILSLLTSLITLHLFTQKYFSPDAMNREHALINRYLKLSHSLKFNTKNFSYICILALFAIAICLKLNRHDDIRGYNPKDSALAMQDRQIRKIMGVGKNFDYFVVKGNTQEQLLRNEEALSTLLDIDHIPYMALHHWIPSLQQQQRSLEAFQSLLPAMTKLYKQLQFPSPNIKAQLLLQKQSQLINVQKWIEHNTNHPIEKFYLGENNGQYYSIVPIFIKNDRLSTLHKYQEHCSNCQLINRIDDINHSINRIKTVFLSSSFLIFSCVLILCIAFFSLKNALPIVFIPFAATVMAMAAAALIHQQLNLFHVLAGLLVFVLGIDYSFFYFFETSETSAATGLGVYLSAISTIFSFGMLAFSSNCAVSSFGIVVTIGILISLFLSPLSRKQYV